MIFLDADYFIAINLPEDSNHARAKVLFTRLESRNDDMVTTCDVIDEVATKLSYYRSKMVSERFLNFLFDSNIRIEYINSGRVSSVIALFLKQTSKRVSLTDCANMVIARSLGVTIVCSFDHHYEQNGFKLLR